MLSPQEPNVSTHPKEVVVELLPPILSVFLQLLLLLLLSLLIQEGRKEDNYQQQPTLRIIGV